MSLDINTWRNIVFATDSLAGKRSLGNRNSLPLSLWCVYKNWKQLLFMLFPLWIQFTLHCQIWNMFICVWSFYFIYYLAASLSHQYFLISTDNVFQCLHCFCQFYNFVHHFEKSRFFLPIVTCGSILKFVSLNVWPISTQNNVLDQCV